MGMNFDPILLISLVVVGFFAIGLHEYAHCKFADMAGDPTPGIYGRVTLNLTKHFEPLGTIMMLVAAMSGIGLGWGRPAPINPARMRNPRWDTFIAVAAGPLSNIVQAVVWALIARVLILAGVTNLGNILVGAFYSNASVLGHSPDLLGSILFTGVWLNLSLAIFNLFPIPPLDGHWLVGYLFMNERTRDKWFLYGRRYGIYVLWALVLIGQMNPHLSIFRLTTPFLQRGTFFLLGIKDPNLIFS